MKKKLIHIKLLSKGASMSNTIDISFIIPVSNKAPVLPYVIENLSKQVGHFVPEYIFIDDASIDASVSTIQENVQKFHLKNVQLIENKEQKGLSFRLNQGILKASGDFLFFMDAGDILAIDAVHHMYERLIISGADMARGFFELSSQKPEKLIDFELKSPISSFISTHPLGTLLAQRHIKRLGVLARYETVIRSGGADSSLYMDDISLTLNLARVSNKMIVITQPLFRVSKHFPLYRTNPKNKFHILHDVFIAYYRFIKFESPHPDEYDLALEHTFKYGMQYITDVFQNPYNLLPLNRYSIYYVLARLFPALKPYVVRRFAQYIKNDKRRWQRGIDLNQIKILPVYEDDIAFLQLYLTQMSKETDSLSSLENPFNVNNNQLKKILSSQSDSIFIKAIYKKEIVGLCFLKKYDLSNTYRIFVSVLPLFWDFGIGSLLIKTGLKIAQEKGIQHIQIYVMPQDKRSLALFKKYGFVHQNKVSEYISETNKIYKTYLLQLDFE